MVGAFKKIGTAVAAYFAVDKIIDFGKEVVNTAAEVAAETSAFEQIMGDYSDEAAAKVSKIADATGMVDTRLTPYMTSMTAKFKGLGYDVEDASSYAARGLNVAADASAFWDKSLDESVSHLNSFINGSYEGGEAIGLFANDTQMAMYAVKSGLIDSTKEWSNLDEATKQATRLEYAENMMKASGATGQAAKEADQYANVQANLTEKWRQFKAQIGEPILQNVVIPTMEKLSGVVDVAREKFEIIRGVAGDVAEFWREVLKPAIDDVVSAFKDTLQPIKDLFSPLGDLKDKTDVGKDAMDLFREACWNLEDKLEALAEKVRNAKDDVENIVQSFKDAKEWANQHETAISLLAVAFGTLTTAVAAYNIVQAIKRAGGLLYLVDLAKTAIGVGALTVAENAHTVATTIATAATTAFGAAVSFLTSPVTLVIAAIGALVAIGVVLYKNWDTIKAKAIEIWGKIKDWIIGVWESISAKASEIWGKIKDFFSNIWQGIKNVATSVWTSIKDFFVNTWNAIKDKFTQIWNSITDFLSQVWDKIKNIVSFGVQLIGSIISAAFQIITLPFRFIWENCKEYVFAAWEWIKEKVSTAINAVKSVITSVMEAIKSVFTTAWNNIKSVVSTAVNAIKEVIKTVWNAIKNFLSPILNSIKSVITTAWNSIKSAVSTAVNAVKTAVTNAFNAVKNKVSEIFNSIKSKITSVWNSIKTFISTTVNSIKEKISSVFNSIKSTITNIFNSVKEKISSVWNSIKSNITEKINGIKSTVTTKFNEIKQKIQEPIEKAKDKIKGLIDEIKGFFDNLKLKFPNIKLPHFSISGEFKLDPPSVPKFSIEWYKKAMNAPMLLSDPTIFGFNPATGQMRGAGEAGEEIVSGSSALMRMIKGAVGSEMSGVVYYLQRLISMLADFFPELIEAAGHDIVTEDGLIVAHYTPLIDKRLGEIQKQKDRGR